MGILFKWCCALRSAGAAVLSASLFRQSCISCATRTYTMPLCPLCHSELMHAVVPLEQRCMYCGRPLISEKTLCFECRSSRTLFHTDGVFPLYPYVLWKKELLFTWKIAGNRSLTPFFASLVYKVLQKYYSGLPVVPVPPRPGKIRKTGWDQIDDLCRCLHGLYGVCIKKMLKRLTSDQQKKLNRKLRLEHAGTGYVLKKEYNPAQPQRHIGAISSVLCRFSFVPEKVVLLDDILTTGVTVETCAHLLKQAGVRSVYAVTLFGC
ncbi:ComF family protein [Treponema lecithinolyticum]